MSNCKDDKLLSPMSSEELARRFEIFFHPPTTEEELVDCDYDFWGPTTKP